MRHFWRKGHILFLNIEMINTPITSITPVLTGTHSPDQIMLPAVLRSRPVPGYAFLWEKAGKAWSRDLKAITLLGVTGWSSRLALNKWLIAHDARLQSEKDGPIKRLWKRMEQRGLVEQRTVTIDRHHNFSVAMVWLTENGRRFLWEQGAPHIILSEWDRLRLAHDGEQQPVHTAMVILAAYLFRRHGFFSEVCPVAEGHFAPDLLLFDTKTGEPIYVEIEAPSRGGRAQSERLRTKWELMTDAQGYVVLCALNPKQRGRRILSARGVAQHGLATDLYTMSQHEHMLWARLWGRFDEGSLPAAAKTITGG